MNAPWPGPLGPPPDVPAMVATILGLLVAWQGRALWGALLRAPKRVALALLGVGALILSIGYVIHYLRGGPRIIDATSYWLQGRALSERSVTWPIDEPTASVRGRFLLANDTGATTRIGVIFPPGYPAVLALGFLAHAPLLVGPVIGALLVAATYALARAVSRREDVALLAATLSVLSVTLRYHTADTMAHGWAALLVCTSLALLYRSADVRPSRYASAAGAGFAIGWLFATRPVTALALLPVFAFAALELRRSARVVVALGAIVPILLFALEQRAITGALFRSTQAAYYAVADGPPGCFRYGFGTGIGCLHEHGPYVDSVLPSGHTWMAATITTLRRLRLHVMDVVNAEPLAALLVLAPFLALRSSPDSAPRARRVLTIAASVPLIIAGYMPFYFDGSYPGGGARFFVDVLPLEQVLVAVAIALLVDRVRQSFLDFRRAAGLACATSLLGFGIHTAYEHAALRERDGGRPFFEPSTLAAAGIDHGLLFVGTDHAFNLAYDPAARDASRQLVVAREYGDDRDRLIWERLGHPAAYRYVFDGHADERPALVAWNPASPPHPYRFEAEAEWPPLAQTGGYVEPVFAQGTCAWGGRLLALHSSADRALETTVSFPVPRPGRFRIAIHLASRGEVTARLTLRRRPDEPPLATWHFNSGRKDFDCATLLEEEANLSTRGLVDVAARGPGELFLDAFAVEPSTQVESAR